MKHATATVQQLRKALDEQRNDRYGPPPVNIFTRLRNTAGPNNTSLSHDALSQRIRVTKQALIRLEQGTFTVPLPSVMDYYTSPEGGRHSELQLRDAYLEYQYKMRERHTLLFGEYLEVDLTNDEHPFRQLRHSCRPQLNPTEVSKALCIPQATLEHFEKKWRTQKSVPKTLISVLRQIGYTSDQVKEFDSSYLAWRSRQLGLNVVKFR